MQHYPSELTTFICWRRWCLMMAGLFSIVVLVDRLHAETMAINSDSDSGTSVLLPVSSQFLTGKSDNQSESPSVSVTIDSNTSARVVPSVSIPSALSAELRSDRLWLVSTRRITSKACCVNLRSPNIRFNRLNCCGRQSPSDLADYVSSMSTDRPRIIYIHGNRRSAPTAISQGLWVYRELTRNRPSSQPMDWVIWSWPSDADSLLLDDVRKKALRTNAQGLYLAWLLNHHHAQSQPTALIGFSFGGRIVTGALHAFAGGSVGGRSLDQPAIVGANYDIGLLAPAVDSTWLSKCGSHRLASQNINRMVLLYNHRDFALKYFRLISRKSNSQALGYTGPRSIAPRYDGTRIPIRARDCANTVGNHHRERHYYENACYAGREMATLIDSSLIIN